MAKKNNINVESVAGTSQYDGFQVLKDSHSLPSHSLRTRDSLTLVPQHFDTFSVSYNSDNNPVKVEYFAGTAPHITNIGFVADSSGSLAGTYFLISAGRKSAKYAVWYSVNGSGSAPGLADAIELEVAINTDDPASVVAYATQLVLENLGDVFEVDRTVAVLNIETVKLGETNNTLNNGTGFTITNTAGDSELVETVNLTYSADGFPIWQGQELKDFKYDVYTGKFIQLIGNVTEAAASRPSEFRDRTHINRNIEAQVLSTTPNVIHTVTSGKIFYLTSIVVSLLNAGNDVGRVIIEDNGNDKLPILISGQVSGSASPSNVTSPSFDEPIQFSTDVSIVALAGVVTASVTIMGYEEEI